MNPQSGEEDAVDNNAHVVTEADKVDDAVKPSSGDELQNQVQESNDHSTDEYADTSGGAGPGEDGGDAGG